MKRAFCLVCISLLIGCTAYMSQQLEEVRVNNRTRLNDLELGFTKGKVLEVMGESTDTLKSNQLRDSGTPNERVIINNPYRSSAFTKSGTQIEILLYYTDLKSNDGAITDDELTPIILIDGKVAGWGWEYWTDVAAKYEIRIR